jgi:hypothetical protein
MHFSFHLSPFPILCLIFCSAEKLLVLPKDSENFERMYVFRLKSQYHTEGNPVSMKTSGFIPMQYKSVEQLGVKCTESCNLDIFSQATSK